jgi:hypothetical protein
MIELTDERDEEEGSDQSPCSGDTIDHEGGVTGVAQRRVNGWPKVVVDVHTCPLNHSQRAAKGQQTVPGKKFT